MYVGERDAPNGERDFDQSRRAEPLRPGPPPGMDRRKQRTRISSDVAAVAAAERQAPEHQAVAGTPRPPHGTCEAAAASAADMRGRRQPRQRATHSTLAEALTSARAEAASPTNQLPLSGGQRQSQLRPGHRDVRGPPREAALRRSAANSANLHGLKRGKQVDWSNPWDVDWSKSVASSYSARF